MADHAEANDVGTIAVQDVPEEQTASYGIVATDGFQDRHGAIQRIVEKPEPADAPSTLAVVGRYILPASIFDHLERTGKGAGGEIQLTDAIASLIKEIAGRCLSLQGHALRLRHPHRPGRSDDPLRARPREDQRRRARQHAAGVAGTGRHRHRLIGLHGCGHENGALRRRFHFPANDRDQSASKMPAAPMPVPMHIVTMPYFCSRRRRPCTMVAVRTAPVAPSGWPSAIAPPSGLTFDGIQSASRGSPPAPARRRLR